MRSCKTYSVVLHDDTQRTLLTLCAECYDKCWAGKIEAQEIIGCGIVCQECGK